MRTRKKSRKEKHVTVTVRLSKSDHAAVKKSASGKRIPIAALIRTRLVSDFGENANG